MLSAKTLGTFPVGTALQTALQLRNAKSILKLFGLDAGSSLSSVTHSSLQTNFHLVVPKLGCGRLRAVLPQRTCCPCSSLASPALSPSHYTAGCTVASPLSKFQHYWYSKGGDICCSLFTPRRTAAKYSGFIWLQKGFTSRCWVFVDRMVTVNMIMFMLTLAG